MQSQTNSTVGKLLRDIEDSSVSTAQLLISAKIIATNLGRDDALIWINRELNGYGGVELDDIPEYRQVRGKWSVFNPYSGWEPVRYESSKSELFLCTAPMRESLPKIEKSLADGNTSFSMHSPEHSRMMRGMLETDWQVQFNIDAGQFHEIVSKVRSLILDWALELKKVGVSGHDSTFTAEERREARVVTQNFIIQNVGVLGNVTDQASVTNNQNATLDLDIGAVNAMVQQARAHLGSLPEEQRVAVEPVLNEIEVEAAKKQPDRGLVRGLLTSARTICEGAAGNLAATGIVGLIRAIIGA